MSQHSSTGYIYVLSNPHVPALYKIGYTDRDPEIRAAELSAHTGVPGKYIIDAYWEIYEAVIIEKKLFSKLAKYRRTGEFFEFQDKETCLAIVTNTLQTLGELDNQGKSIPWKTRQAKKELVESESRERRENENAAFLQWNDKYSKSFEIKALHDAERYVGVTCLQVKRIYDEHEEPITMFKTMMVLILFTGGLALLLLPLYLWHDSRSSEKSGRNRAIKDEHAILNKAKTLYRQYARNYFSKNNIDPDIHPRAVDIIKRLDVTRCY